MIICPAQAFDIFQIMNIERQSFIPSIQEKKRVFEKRLKVFPQGFLLLADCSDEIVLKNKVALVCGYLCAEKWDSLPDFDAIRPLSGAEMGVVEKTASKIAEKMAEKEQKSALKRIEKRFALGHNPLLTHKTNGSFLYISSFALLKEYRGKGLGESFFKNSLAALCAANPEVKKVVILVDSEWQVALKIYEKLGFQKLFELKEFFPTIQKKVNASGIIMTAEADSFRGIEFSDNGNELSGIRI